MAILDDVREAIALEAQALKDMEANLDDAVVSAVSLLLACRGRVIFTGMGKAGHIARKLAATFSSTGTPSFFVHPGEAFHGDLGVITRHDLAVILSNSGETEEVIKLIPCFRQFGLKCIALTGNSESTLAQSCDVTLNTGVEREACPLNCAPTSSTTTALAMGDALACALIKAKGFTKEDFARFHPGGSLGYRLLSRVEDFMVPLDQTPLISPQSSVREAIVQISAKRLGAVIVHENGNLGGIFTDGDLRRLFETGACADLDAPIESVMTRNPIRVTPQELAASAFALMEEKHITFLPVTTPEGEIAGCLQLHRLLEKGIS